jgi:hypothetical protein
MALNKYLRLLAVAVCVAVATVACKVSITMNGSVLDYNIYKTIRVSDFPIRTALVYPPLQQTFENTLLDYIAKNTRLQTTEGASDLELEGEITGYNLTPQAVTEDAYASMTRLTITVRVKYIDNRQENKDIDQSFSAYRDFPATEMLTDVQDQLCEEITKELVDLIFNATLGNW